MGNLEVIFMKCMIIDRNKIVKKIKFNGKISDLLSKLNINPEVVILKRNGRLVTELDAVRDKDELEIVRVVYGG
jgi:sulfur carrier protein